MSRPGSEGAAVYRRLLAYVAPHWPIIAAAVAATGVYAGANAMFPLIMRDVISYLEGGVSGVVSGPWIPLLILAVFALRGAMDFLSAYGLSWAGRSVVRDLRSELFAHYIRLPAAYYDLHPAGALLSKLTYDAEQVAEAISNAVVTVLRDGMTIVVLLGVMIYLSPELTVVIAVVAPVVGMLVGYMSRAFRRYSARIQVSMGDVTQMTEQALAAQRIIKVFAGQAGELTRFEGANEKNFRLHLRLVGTRAAGDALTQYAIALGVAAVIFIAFSDWLLTDLGAPTFVGFIMAMAQIVAPLKRLVNINAAVQRGIAAAESLFAVLDEPDEPDDGSVALTRATGHVEYRHVSFGYGGDRAEVLSDVSFDARPGSVVAIVGRSGSGKSTLVNLLPRFYEVTAGSIQLDGRDIRDYVLGDLRRQLSFVGQDVVLFDDSIAANIAYGALAGCSRSDIERAADAAFVLEFAEALPDGLDTRVGERGALLSGGQRQRVAIARALLKDAPVLILDEATSALDSESERKVQTALQRLMSERTTLVIAHRLSTVEHADLIVVMHEGKLVEQGSHADLLQRDGYYSMLHRMQFA